MGGKHGLPRFANLAALLCLYVGIFLPDGLIFLSLASNVPLIMKYGSSCYCSVAVALFRPDVYARARFKPPKAVVAGVGLLGVVLAVGLFCLGFQADWRPYALIGTWVAPGLDVLVRLAKDAVLQNPFASHGRLMANRRTFLHLALSAALTDLSVAHPKSTAVASEGLLASRSVALSGEHSLRYTLHLAATVLRAAHGTPESRIVTASYLGPPSGLKTRPVCFAFNGGPGGSSAFLHLLVLGPRRINLPSDPGVPVRQPYSWADNPATPLSTADLVFIDPVGTGLSRLIDPSKLGEYYSVDGDGRYIADYIRRWLREHRRMDSPGLPRR